MGAPLKHRDIPDSVTHLTIGDMRGPLKKGDIPDSVEYLTLGKNFNQSFQGIIPSYTHVIFEDCSYPICNIK